MIAVSIHEAKTQLSSLLTRVEEKHEDVWICRNGKPVARLAPLERGTIDPLKCNPKLKPIAIHGDLTAPVLDTGRASDEDCSHG